MGNGEERSSFTVTGIFVTVSGILEVGFCGRKRVGTALRRPLLHGFVGSFVRKINERVDIKKKES